MRRWWAVASPHDKSPVLADAADVLSDQLRQHMRRLGALLSPHTGELERKFDLRLKRMGLEARMRQALLAITPGSVARVLGDGRAAGSFFEQVEYHGRRLAKLNVPPARVLAGLQEYDKLLTPLLKRLIPDEHGNFQWVRDQLHFCVILTLNNAYYQVRETETEAFYELFRGELESRNLDQLSERFLTTLSQFCRADAAAIHWLEQGREQWRSSNGAGVRNTPELEREVGRPCCWSWDGAHPAGNAHLLDRTWARRYRTCWSVPLMSGDSVTGVMQFAFLRPYEWLPREQELLMAAAERCQMGAEKARLVEDLGKREEQVRSLAERMLHVEEAERRRISRELHDEAGQSLLCVRLQLEMIEQSLPEEAAAVRERLAAARAETEKTILEIRRLLAALSPAVLEQLGLAAALRQLVTRMRQMHPVRVKLQLHRLQQLPKGLESIVYRLVQECCHNVVKHSMASTVNLSASTADQVFRLLVEDDGIGFHVEDALEKRNSYGLSGIRERVTLMGGTISIESWPAQARVQSVARAARGTRIRIELPIPRENQSRSRNLKNVG
ncbi:MAG: GAF domain-containing sensor histidine kinase [Bryobacteraceae bacterium]|nr:GAF domain-containing sensor histidine kinase [Bryobacteraceae bacterium]